MHLRWLSLALIAWALPALADLVSVPGVPSAIGGNQGGVVYLKGGSGGGGGGPALVANTAPPCYTAGFTTSFSFSSVPTGVGTVVLGISGGNSTTYSAVQLSGRAMTSISAGAETAMYYLGGNTNATDTVTFTASAATAALCIATYLMTGLTSSTPTSVPAAVIGSLATPTTGPALTVNAGGIGIIMMGLQGTATTPMPLIWTGASRDAATEQYNVAGNQPALGGAHMTTSATSHGGLRRTLL
jgi:hypothetical protein